MNNFRHVAPKKREAPKAVTHYRQYKHELKEDFNSKCGYCNDSDHWTGGWRFFQLDHFVPKKHLVTISVNEYKNLVYSCFFCNNAKRAKWPTKDEKIHHNGVEGYVFPKDDEYLEHIDRDDNGNIVHLSEVGKYMIKSMKLNLKRHTIIWNLEKAERNLTEVMEIFEKINDRISRELAVEIIALFNDYLKYTKLLRTVDNA